MAELCAGCRTFVEMPAAPAGPVHCVACAATLPPTAEQWMLAYLMLTIPFEVGDRVEARTAGELFDGVGTVTEVSMSLEHGGTPVYPTFRVVIDSPAYDQAPAEQFYTEMCLTKVSEESRA